MRLDLKFVGNEIQWRFNIGYRFHALDADGTSLSEYTYLLYDFI